MAEEILSPWIDNSENKFLCFDKKRGCLAALCCNKGNGEKEIDYNTYENQRMMTIVDIFLHLDQISDNNLTERELQKFVKILEKSKD